MKKFLTLILMLVSFNTLLAYSGGNGTQTSPYEIATVADLLEMSGNTDDYDKYFILTNNIDMSTAGTFDKAVIAPDTDGSVNWSFGGTVFTGKFNGAGHKISNMRISNANAEFLGLFGMLGSGAEISDLTLSNVDVSGCWFVGSLTGDSHGAKITGCHASCNISGQQNVGGLVGYHGEQSDMVDCSTTGYVQGDYYVGGLAGYCQGGDAIACQSSAEVQGDHYVGGLVGRMYNYSSVLSSFGTGSASGNYYVGGLVGNAYNHCYITNCYADVYVVSNQWYIGGLIGGIQQSTVSGCISSSRVVGKYETGGLIGCSSNSNINNCYTNCDISGYGYICGLISYSYYDNIMNCLSQSTVTGYGYYYGGLIGYMHGSALTGNFWDYNLCPLDGVGNSSSVAGATPLNSSDFSNISIFTNAGWDMVDETANGSEDIWRIADHIRLAWESFYITEFQANVTVNEREMFDTGFRINSVFDGMEWQATVGADSNWLSLPGISSGKLAAGKSAYVPVKINSAGLLPGIHDGTIVISNGAFQISVQIRLEVINVVGMQEFAMLATYWLESDCQDEYNNCNGVDWYIDGEINTMDLMKLAQYWQAQYIEPEKPATFDGFESGDFTHLDWRNTGDSLWTIDPDMSYTGKNSIRSGDISNSQSSRLSLTVDTTGYNTISFAFMVSCEKYFDALWFYIDGEPQAMWYGWGDWQEVYFEISEGEHTFTWEYVKDKAFDANDDCVWLDNIQIFKSE